MKQAQRRLAAPRRSRYRLLAGDEGVDA
jgi:hypothetical protein